MEFFVVITKIITNILVPRNYFGTVLWRNPRSADGDSQRQQLRPELQDWLWLELFSAKKIMWQGRFQEWGGSFYLRLDLFYLRLVNLASSFLLTVGIRNNYPPAQNQYMQEKTSWEFIFVWMHAGPVFEYRETFLRKYFPYICQNLGEFIWVRIQKKTPGKWFVYCPDSPYPLN